MCLFRENRHGPQRQVKYKYYFDWLQLSVATYPKKAIKKKTKKNILTEYIMSDLCF